MKRAIESAAFLSAAEKESRHWGKLSFPLHPCWESYSAKGGTSTKTSLNASTKLVPAKSRARGAGGGCYLIGLVIVSRIFARGAFSLKVTVPLEARWIPSFCHKTVKSTGAG
jgi:hypothetical protein